jgi:hypothetical protein
VRQLAVVGLILIPILCGSGFAWWKYYQSLPPKNIIVLVAEFGSVSNVCFELSESSLYKDFASSHNTFETSPPNLIALTQKLSV